LPILYSIGFIPLDRAGVSLVALLVIGKLRGLYNNLISELSLHQAEDSSGVAII
jgi:hypothetical protein